ncbi:cation transport protein-domain-containing protein [Immersiella caudata]|uniref:Potassium transport protein n=1 Tax=Immersiella caudata TaxID=314043 RepID=A0AA40C3E8_9PEZI|nr:cation transport protein-domain-containing protein [Immersiella caudata]
MPPWWERTWNWTVDQAKALRPSFLSKNPHFNFISVHYFWIIFLALLGSVVIYSSGRENVAYIDALFFSSGASTQAGLNTVDFNRLNTFQQVVCYIIPMLANPITINSFVVFLRLYWFEKRFQNLVSEARTKRGTISKSKTRPRDDIQDAEKGVNGRSITVMRNGQPSRITNDGIVLSGKVKDVEDSGSSDMSGAGSSNGHANGHVNNIDNSHNNHNPNDVRITFAETVKRSDGLGEDAAKLPPARSEEEQHLAILKRQREDNEVLRIPGRLEAEQGLRPERVEHDEHDDQAALEATRSRVSEFRPQAITIAEPDREMLRAAKEASETIAGEAKAVAGALSFLRPRKPRFLNEKDTKIHHEEDAIHPPGRWRVQKRQTINALRTALSGDKDEGTPYLSWEPTIGRNSAFPDLSEEQREELGGIEYRSLKTLALVLTWYFWGFSLLGIIGLVPWILNVNRWGEVVDAAAQNRTWWGFFTANSAFMDLGFTLTPDSMNSFNTAVWPLLLMCFLIVIGNTGFPVMLRFIIWVMSLVIPRGTGLYEELRFLLDHPRRCFTLLFPSGATWWLFWLLIILNGLDVIFFIVLDLGTGVVAEMPAGIKILNGLFEAASTRTAGFSCVNLADLHPGVQVSYMIMMYISVFPIAISVRRTNVYEEQSLGIYGGGGGGEDIEEQVHGSDLSYVGAHLRRQLSFDLWYIFVGLFILAISEGPRVMAHDFGMFEILFEVISAYGTVGMSLGYPGVNASLCSQFSVVGKLVLIAMMIRGRHRGLPYGLDRAILLPSEALNAKEAADAEARMARQQSHVSVATAGPRGSTAARRRRSLSGDRAGVLFTSVFHPGPAKMELPGHNPLHRRSTSQGVEDPEPYARSSSRYDPSAESSASPAKPRRVSTAI